MAYDYSVNPESTRTGTGDATAPHVRVAAVVHRLMADRTLDRSIGSDDDLREAGLTSLDMVSLVLAVEAEFALLIPEEGIKPANFRSIAAISTLVHQILAAR